MNKIKSISILFVTSLLVGCVVFPTSRTYFEPNPEDGKLTRSQSCGYNRAGNDSLERDVEGLDIKVTPSYQQGAPVSVTILFRYSSGDIKLQPEQFELQSSLDGRVYKTNEISQNVYEPDTGHPYHSIWIHLKYPVTSEKIESIKLVLPGGSVKRNGMSIDINPFRFNRVTKFDFYYGSINC